MQGLNNNNNNNKYQKNVEINFIIIKLACVVLVYATFKKLTFECQEIKSQN